MGSRTMRPGRVTASDRKQQRAQRTARLETLCAGLAAELGIEPPTCTVLDTDRLVAGVRLGRPGGNGRLVVSSGVLEQLDPMAQRWILAHELGHLADHAGRRVLRVARCLFALGCLTVFLAVGLLPVPFGHAVAVPLVLASTVGGLRLRRRLERAADRTAHGCCATDPDAGRRALTAVRRSQGRAPEPLFRLAQAISGYPPFDERLTAPAR